MGAPEYANRDDFIRFGNEILLEERRLILKAATERPPDGTTFLAHSTKDLEQLPGLVRLLENHGAYVYIDKLDGELPAITSRSTAEVLRQRIRACSRFLVFATPNSKDSRWVPWELGLSDAFKGSARTAIFPSLGADRDESWVDREYMCLYDRVVWGELQGHQGKIWMVWNPSANEATPLSSWLKS